MEHRIFRIFLLVCGSVAILTQSAAGAETVVWGTGNPQVDVPAVQAAVDQGGIVNLRGYFSFAQPPTVATALPQNHPPATVLISRAVAIAGAYEGEDEQVMTTIEGGTIPFYVQAPGSSVAIERLRFIRPTNEAIFVFAVSNLTIASCKVEGIVPLSGYPANGAIDLNTSGSIPSPTQPGHPEYISGSLVIANNAIDLVGGTAFDNTLGITIWSVGQSPAQEVDVYISGNDIRNTTEPAINFRRIGGRAHVEGNVITTGPVSSQLAPRPEVIRVANIGSYVIAHNSIDSAWPDPNAIGIGVFSQFAAWPIEHAVVVDNAVTMLPPAGTAFGNFSAGIDVRGYAHDNFVANNRIGGRGRAALAVDVFNGGIPDNNAFALNRFDDFEASTADVIVGKGVTNTLMLGQNGTVQDQGINTVIRPF
jgi:hypothetical protein